MAITLSGTTGISAPKGVGQCYVASVSGDVTLDFSTYQNFIITLTGDTTLLNPSTETIGQSGFIVVKQDGTGSRSFSLNTNFKTAGQLGIPVSSIANSIDVIPYIVIGADEILFGQPQKNFA